jgi:GNAT superfamily N-acetyltransferase
MLRNVTDPIRNPAFATRLARNSEVQQFADIDDAASALFTEAGLDLHLDPAHPLVLAEKQSWVRAISAGLAHVAVDAADRPIGFMTLGFVDGAPYLEQLSVHPRSMRQGIGRALIEQAFSWSAPQALWLTTYSHLPWNRPYYERHGFVVVPEDECGPELRSILKVQRSVLPAPEMRVAMVARCGLSANV